MDCLLNLGSLSSHAPRSNGRKQQSKLAAPEAQRVHWSHPLPVCGDEVRVPVPFPPVLLLLCFAALTPRINHRSAHALPHPLVHASVSCPCPGLCLCPVLPHPQSINSQAQRSSIIIPPLVPCPSWPQSTVHATAVVLLHIHLERGTFCAVRQLPPILLVSLFPSTLITGIALLLAPCSIASSS